MRLDIVSQMAHSKEILTTKDVAELLGMNERVVRKNQYGINPCIQTRIFQQISCIKRIYLEKLCLERSTSQLQ